MTVPDLVPLPFETEDGIGHRAKIGLIVLETDHTIEAEARLIKIPGVDFYHSRIPNEIEVTPTTLTDMQERLPAAAGLLPPAFGFKAIGFGCTSASTLIGADGVTTAVQSKHPGIAVTNPISAAVAAFCSLTAERIAIVTPYTAEVTAPIAQHFSDAGFRVSALGSFLESNDLTVARISQQSIANGIRSVTANTACDAVFVSCTSLRMFEAVAELEVEVGLPIVSSNIALLWHLLRLADVYDELEHLGRLFGRQLAE